ncbi:MAG: hypothetical protein KDA62_15150 [Planctomycetales bacterium]|nr:hypothetical protein [Planctomycetales bacterium]
MKQKDGEATRRGSIVAFRSAKAAKAAFRKRKNGEATRLAVDGFLLRSSN